MHVDRQVEKLKSGGELLLTWFQDLTSLVGSAWVPPSPFKAPDAKKTKRSHEAKKTTPATEEEPVKKHTLESVIDGLTSLTPNMEETIPARPPTSSKKKMINGFKKSMLDSFVDELNGVTLEPETGNKPASFPLPKELITSSDNDSIAGTERRIRHLRKKKMSRTFKPINASTNAPLSFPVPNKLSSR